MSKNDPYRVDDDQAWNDGGVIVMWLLGAGVFLAALIYFGTVIYKGLGG